MKNISRISKWDFGIVFSLLLIMGTYLTLMILIDLGFNISLKVFEQELMNFDFIYGSWALLLGLWFGFIPFTTKYSKFAQRSFKNQGSKARSFITAFICIGLGIYSLTIGFK